VYASTDRYIARAKIIWILHIRSNQKSIATSLVAFDLWHPHYDYLELHA
jgi:hypothetical protein